MSNKNSIIIPVILGASLTVAAIGYGALSLVWDKVKQSSDEKACDLYRLSPEGQKAELQARTEGGFKPIEYKIKTPQGITCKFN